MPTAGIRIGNQPNCHVPARLPYEFAVGHGFDAFEWFSDKGRRGWCEDDVPPAERAELRRTAQQHGILFSVHVSVAADPTTPSGAEAIRRSIRFGGDVGAGVVNLHLFPKHGATPFAEALRPLLEVARSTGCAPLPGEHTPDLARPRQRPVRSADDVAGGRGAGRHVPRHGTRQPVPRHAQRLPRVRRPTRRARPDHSLARP